MGDRVHVDGEGKGVFLVESSGHGFWTGDLIHTAHTHTAHTLGVACAGPGLVGGRRGALMVGNTDISRCKTDSFSV